ncbi:MAG: hypothetical protein CME07_03880, partial [Gemmatimonadetes bacterium]|nr:hypothetical protein [Gemmatimonadota bacterium]
MSILVIVRRGLAAGVLAAALAPPALACDSLSRQDLAMPPDAWGVPRLQLDCPEPPCVPDTACGTFETNTAFVRLDSLAASPIYTPPCKGSYCFTIDKGSDSTYYHLHPLKPDSCHSWVTDSGLYASTSTDGLTWTLGGLAFPSTGSWYASIKCPDVHYGEQPGEMYLYFQGEGNGIGRADSQDGGLSFVDSGAPVLTSDDPANTNVRTPSVVHFRGKYYMVYNEVCSHGGPPFMLATLNLKVSDDGYVWEDLDPNPNPILIAGECDQFDRGGVGLGQLVADPDGRTLHLFYAGTGWLINSDNGGLSNRGCVKIGHAQSTDLGLTWCKTGSPVLDHPPAGTLAWDTVQYMVTSYTWEKGPVGEDRLRMYYWGEGPVDPGCHRELGVAEAVHLPECSATGVAEIASGGGRSSSGYRV